MGLFGGDSTVQTGADNFNPVLNLQIGGYGNGYDGSFDGTNMQEQTKKDELAASVGVGLGGSGSGGYAGLNDTTSGGGLSGAFGVLSRYAPYIIGGTFFIAAAWVFTRRKKG